MDPMISYESIRAVHRAEKDEQLSKLPDGFFRAVRQWLSHKKGRGDTNSLLEAESAKKLLEDIINRRQRKILFAALASARGAAPPRNMSVEEGKFFDRVLELLKVQQAETKEKLLGAGFEIEQKMEEARQSVEEMRAISKDNISKEGPKDVSRGDVQGVETNTPSRAQPRSLSAERPLKPLNSTKKVKILIELPRFIGTDKKEYGPFKPGDRTEVPEDVFNLLAMRGAAELLKV